MMKRIIVLTLAVLMLAALTVPAFAQTDMKSPEPQKYNAECVSANSSQGTVAQTVNTDGSVTFTALPVTHAFSKWEITGEYDIVSGALNEKVITVMPKSDIKAVAHFDGKLIESPETGTGAVSVISLLALASFAAMAYAGKRVRD